MRQSQVISFSLPPEWLRELKAEVGHQGVSLSEFVRKAIAQRLRASQWKRIRRKGAAAAKKFKVSPEDIEEIVDQFRE